MLVGEREIETVFRRDHGRVFSNLMRKFRDFDEVEDGLQEAYVRALARWPIEGVPTQPAAWITTVAHNQICSRGRHASVVHRSHEVLQRDAAEPHLADPSMEDERLRLLFTCCHPALSTAARVTLTLRTVCGLSPRTIARLTYSEERTVAQRLVRAKRKIRVAAIPYALPIDDELHDRIDDVLVCIYLLFSAGYVAGETPAPAHQGLCEEAARLARVMTQAFFRHAEAAALLALVTLHRARAPGRFDVNGCVVALEDQDRSTWDPGLIAEGLTQLQHALAAGARGEYALQASVAALHAEAGSFAETDWPQIAGLYREMRRRSASAAIVLASAYAEGMAEGAELGLTVLTRALEAGIVTVQTPNFDATRAALLARAGHASSAADAYLRAADRATHPRIVEFLQRRAASVAQG